MRHHSIICRLGETDDQDLALLEPGSVITNIRVPRQVWATAVRDWPSH